MKLRSRISLWFFIVLLLVCVLWAVCNYFVIRVQNKYLVKQKTELKETVDIYARYVFLSSALAGRQFPNVQITDTLGNKIELSTFLEKKKKFIALRISDRYCQKCVGDAVGKMLRYVPLSKLNDLVFFAECGSARLLNKLADKLGVRDFELYNLPKTSFEAEDFAVPYCFVTDTSLVVSSIFFPSNVENSVDSIYVDVMCKSLDLK